MSVFALFSLFFDAHGANLLIIAIFFVTLHKISKMNMEQENFDKLSYALGMSMGNNFRASGIESIDVQSFTEGVSAVFAGKQPLMTYAEAKQIIQDFFTQMQQMQQAAAEQAAKINAEKGQKYLAENGARAEVTTTASGLQYEVLEEGTGAQPSATDSVTVHYTGRLIDGTVFDSSEERGEPATFGVNQVISGWVEALQLMKEGAKWRLHIPANLAYGPQGVPGIGPNETLIFDVTLISVNKK